MRSRTTPTELAKAVSKNPSLRLRKVPQRSQKASGTGSAAVLPTSLLSPVEPEPNVTGDYYRPPLLRFTVWGNPVPKPRMTQSDRWKTRPCVLRYREWADAARISALSVGVLPLQPGRLVIAVYLPIPKSWNVYRREHARGQPHRYRGDVDNFIKSCADALYPKGDEMIHDMHGRKFWEDKRGPRVEIAIY